MSLKRRIQKLERLYGSGEPPETFPSLADAYRIGLENILPLERMYPPPVTDGGKEGVGNA